MSKWHKLPRYWEHREYESPINIYRVAKGLTHKELAEKAKTDIASTVGFANGTMSPIYIIKKGGWKPSALRIANVLEVDIECLFPRYFCKIAIPQELTDDQVLCMTMSHQSLRNDQPEACYEFQEIMNILLTEIGYCCRGERDFYVFRMHLLGHTLDDIGRKINCSKERARQLVKKVQNRLRDKPIIQKLVAELLEIQPTEKEEGE